LRSNDEEILNSFLASDLTGDLFGEILEKLGEKEEEILVDFSGFRAPTRLRVIPRLVMIAESANPRRLPGCGPGRWG
jgi:hypothetical protein